MAILCGGAELYRRSSQNNNVEIVSVADYNINLCIDCNSCFTREGNKCFQNDDIVQIYEKLRNADIVAIASPEYFYDIKNSLTIPKAVS